MWGQLTLAMCVLASVWCGPLPDEDDTWSPGLKMAYGTYHQCEQQEDIFSCLKLRALRFMDRAIQKDSIPLLEGVTLVKTPDESRSIPETLPSTEVVESALPANAEDRHDRLNELLLERVRLFMTTHSLQLNMPRYFTEPGEVPLDTFLEEGRGKKKKKKNIGGILMLALAGKLLLSAIGGKLVGLLAAKALLVSKLALALALVVTLLKFLGRGGGGGGGGGGDGGGGEKTTYEIIKVPYIAHADGGHDHGGGGGGYGGGGGGYGSSGGGGGGHHYDSSGGGGGGYGGGWGRSLQDDPHMLAYRAHISHESQGTTTPKLR